MLRQQGLARARSIIANAEQEAQAVITAARVAAEAAEAQARARVNAILAGRSLPPESSVATSDGEQPGIIGTSKISSLPSEGSTLRYRLAVQMSFGAMLRLKRDIARFPGVTSVQIAPSGAGRAELSLQAADSADMLRRLRSIPILSEGHS